MSTNQNLRDTLMTIFMTHTASSTKGFFLELKWLGYHMTYSLCQGGQKSDHALAVADPGGGGGKGAMTPPPACKNRPKKDGHQMRQLIFHVSWPPLSEVSGSATDCWHLPDLSQILALGDGKITSSSFCPYSINFSFAAQDRSPFCIFHIMNKIWQHPELMDTFLVGNHCHNH